LVRNQAFGRGIGWQSPAQNPFGFAFGRGGGGGHGGGHGHGHHGHHHHHHHFMPPPPPDDGDGNGNGDDDSDDSTYDAGYGVGFGAAGVFNYTVNMQKLAGQVASLPPGHPAKKNFAQLQTAWNNVRRSVHQ